MVKSELKLFKKPEKSKQRQELDQFLVINKDIVNRLLDSLKSLVLPNENQSTPSPKQKDIPTSQSSIRDIAIKFLECKTQGEQVIFVKRLESTTGRTTISPFACELADQLASLALTILFEQRSPNLQINRSLITLLNNTVLNSVNQQLLSNYLIKLFPQQLDNSNNSTLIYYAHLITVLSDLKPAIGFMKEIGCQQALNILEWLLVDQLSVMQQQVGTVYLNEIYADCDYTLRALMSLYNAYNEHLSLLLPKQTNIIVSLDRLLSSAQLPRQIIGLSAFLFTECLTLVSSYQLQYQQQVIGHFISNNNTTSSDEQPLFLENLLNSYNKSNNKYIDRFNSYPHLSRVSIFRGLCLSTRLAWLTAPIDKSINIVNPQIQQPTTTSTTTTVQSIFLNYVYLEIVSACNSAIDVFGRVASLEYLHLWYETLLQHLEHSTLESILHVDYQHFFSNYFNMVLEIIFTNWESTISSIPTQLNEIFNCLLSIHYKCLKQTTTETGVVGSASTFVPDITIRLLDEPWSQKGKYALLRSIIDVEGALFMFSLKGNFLKDILIAMSDHTICNSAKGFLELLMESLKKEVIKQLMLKENITTITKEHEPIIQDQCELYWLIPLLNVLTDCDDSTSAKIILYGTPCFLKVFPNSLISILDILNKDTKKTLKKNTDHLNIDNKISLRISLSVLNTARQLSILEGVEIIKNNYSTINQSLYNQDDSLRMLGLELICCTPKNTERPTRIEINLLKEFLSLALKSSSPFIRNHTNSILEKFWVRLRESYAKVFRTTTGKSATSKTTPTQTTTEQDEMYLGHEEVSDFLNWCLTLFISSLYPGAPYPRKMLPIDAFANMIDAWSVDRFQDKPAVLPFLKYLDERSTKFSPKNTLILINNLWDQYDRCREVSSAILAKFPSPLPGFSEEQPIKALVLWGLKLACSPKARESDTGAMVLRLYLTKYVALGLNVPTFNAANQQEPISLSNFQDRSLAILHYIRQIMRVLASQVSLASSNLLEASKYAPMHGLILSIRYLLASPIIDFNQLEKQPELKKQWKLLVSDLVQMMFNISNIVLRVVADSAPEGYNPQNNNDNSSSLLPKSLPSGILYDDDERLASSFATLSAAEKNSTSIEELLEQVGGAQSGDDGNGGNQDDEDSLLPPTTDQIKGSAGQIITVCSWQSMKQLSLCLGAILDRVTFPTLENQEDTLLSVEQISEIGRSFVHILLNTRHKGAIEKAYLGFQVLCSRLMGSTLPTLFSLPSTWIDSLFKRVQEQSLSITRRSAGLPFVFTGLLTGESTHQKKIAGPLLQLVITTLLKMSSGQQEESKSNVEHEDDLAEQRIYLPQVHSINILRSIFRNKAMTNELDQYFAETMIAIVRAYSSPSWSVRNAATMAFSTMVDKVVGVKKVKDETSHLNSTTFHYFFGHMPALHPFLLEHFDRSLTEIKKEHHSSDHILQSSIYAILVLFARLQPSNMTDPADSLSPTPFIPFISQCCAFSNFMVRQIAARALVPFIPSRDVISFIRQLISTVSESSRDFNRIHGVLLQIYHLLKSHIPMIPSIKDREQMIVDAIESMKPLLWILAKRVVPLAYIIFQIFNELSSSLSNLVGNSTSKSSESIQSIFTQVNHFALNVLEITNGNEQTNKLSSIPLFSSYIREAALNVLILIESVLVRRNHTSISSNNSTFNGMKTLLSMLSHKEYEIRLVSIKFLLNHIQVIVNEHDDVTPIQIQLMEMFKKETSIACLKRVTRILPKLGLPLDLQGNQLLESLLHMTVHSGIKKDAIVLFGHAFKQYCEQQQSSTSNTLSEKWMEMVSSYSNAEKSHEIRWAITLALEATSSLLVDITSPKIPNKVAIEMWLALSTLLEDDEDSIRSKSQSITWSILKAIGGSNNTGTLTCDTAKSIQAIYSHLTKTYSNDRYLVDKYLSILISNGSNIYSNEFKSSVVLFDKEEDNYFKEPMVVLQVVSSNLLDIIKTKDLFEWSTMQSELTKLVSYAKWIKTSTENNKHSVWNNWLTFNQDVYLPFYQCCSLLIIMMSQKSLFLSTGAAASSPGDEKDITCKKQLVLNHIELVKSTLSNLPIHPLMNNILYKLEKQFIKNISNENIDTKENQTTVFVVKHEEDHLNLFYLTSL